MDAATTCSLDSLPDSLLGHIMALAGREHTRSLVGVSNRWRRVCFGEPALWRSFTVHACRVSEAAAEQVLRLGCRAALLARVARHVRCFRWEEHTEEWQLTAALCLYSCLAALHGGQLEQLQLSGPCPSLAGADAVAALQQLGSTVARLHLGACSAGTAAYTAAALCNHLRSLQLSTRELPPALLNSIAHMPQLTALRIEAYVWPDLGPLTRISQLRQLVLLDVRFLGGDEMRPPEPASFPAGLERFSFECKHRSFELAGCTLSRLRVWQGATVDFGAGDGAPLHLPLPTLAVGCMSLFTPLPRLLGALHPAGAPPRTFQRLELSGMTLDPADVAGYTQLAQLSELSVANIWHEDVEGLFEQLVSALLQQASRLRSLALRSSTEDLEEMLWQVPARLASYCGLTSLSLTGQHLEELPAGEYLTGLHRLDLSGNRFDCLGPALSTATALTHLTLNGCHLMQLTEADTAVLLALPRLQQLEIEGIRSAEPALIQQWQLRMPNLRIVPMPPEAAA